MRHVLLLLSSMVLVASCVAMPDLGPRSAPGAAPAGPYPELKPLDELFPPPAPGR